MVRGLAIVLCALCGCLRDPTFHGYEGTRLDIITDAFETNETGMVTVSLPTVYTMLFSDRGAKFPTQLAILRDGQPINFFAEGVRGTTPAEQAHECADERFSGMAVYPLDSVQGASEHATGDLTVSFAGDSAVQASIAWSQNQLCDTVPVKATGTTTYTFLLDNRIVRHDEMTVMPTSTADARLGTCGCSPGDTIDQWIFGSFMTLSTDVLATLEDNGLDLGALVPNVGDATSTTGQICARGNLGQRKLAIGYEHPPRARRRAAMAVSLVDEFLSQASNTVSIDTTMKYEYETNATYLVDNSDAACMSLSNRLAALAAEENVDIDVNYDGRAGRLLLDPSTGMFSNDQVVVMQDKAVLELSGPEITGPFTVRVDFDGRRKGFRVFNEGRGDTPHGRTSDDGTSVYVFFLEGLKPGQRITIVGDR